MQPWCLITPASRGIGRELARLLLQRTNVPVVATARNDIDKVKEELLKVSEVDDEHRLHVLRVDVTDEQTIADAAQSCNKLFDKQSHYLHLALAIPGILHPEKKPSQITAQNNLQTYQTNALGPLLLIKHFSPFLPKKGTTLNTSTKAFPTAATWANMSARVGSIGDNKLGGWYSYRMSKAALNQATKTFDNYLRTAAGDKAVSVALHPGTVKTYLSKEFWASVRDDKLFEPAFAAERLLDVVRDLPLEGRGKCWDWEGKEVPP